MITTPHTLEELRGWTLDQLKTQLAESQKTVEIHHCNAQYDTIGGYWSVTEFAIEYLANVAECERIQQVLHEWKELLDIGATIHP